MATLRARLGGRQAVRSAARAPAAGAGRADRAVRGAGRAQPRPQGARSRPSRRSAASSPTSTTTRRGRGRARGHGEPRRRVVDQPGRLDQPGGDLVGRRPDRLVRRRHRHAGPLARDGPRPAHRARDRRDEPGRAAGRAGRHLEVRGRAAAADRHDLRPVRRPRARAVVVRDLRRRPVDPRRDAVGDHARAGGRGAPVDHHARDRHRAAGLHGVGAGLRPGLRMGVPRRALPAGPPGRALGLLPPVDPAARPGPRRGSRRRPAARRAPAAGARRRLPPARLDARPGAGGRDRGDGGAGAGGACARPRSWSATAAPRPRSSA